MKTLGASIVICTAFLAAINVNAESIKVDMKPGLWQNDIKMLGDSASQMQSMQQEQMKQAMADMKKQFANMPPEQRKQMELYMAQAGMKIDGESMTFENGNVSVTPTSTSVKSCVTQAEIDRGEVADNSEGCTSTLKQLAINRFKSTQVCSGDSPSTMEAEVVFDSPKHYTGKGRMNQTMNGNPHVIEVAIEGAWLKSDCGDVKPDAE